MSSQLQDTLNMDSSVERFNEIELRSREQKSLRQLYFILFTLGENFPAHKSFVSFDTSIHEKYIHQAYLAGKVLAAALFENGGGFILMMEAETDYEIHKFIREHPEVQAKRLQAKIKLCKPVFWKMF
ncbi:MAG TPA: hypothetical protein PKK99_13175 [Bacteroidia bacterium]|nr:hypothetical protein [Bacteroidia bacterium]HNQ00004.1 hypothetical protein [Bacteroidia bacterium]